jgi:hypothetical protein
LPAPFRIFDWQSSIYAAVSPAPQAHAHHPEDAVAFLQVTGRIEVAWPGKIDIDNSLDCGGTIAHDENAIGALHGFFNVVRNEENGFLFALPDAHQIGTHFFIRNRL